MDKHGKLVEVEVLPIEEGPVTPREDERRLAISRRAALAGVGLMTCSLLLPQVAAASTLGHEYNVYSFKKNTWEHNYNERNGIVVFDMCFKINSASYDRTKDAWNVSLQFYKSVSKTSTGTGINRVWFNAHVHIYNNDREFTSLGPGRNQEVPDYGTVTHHSPVVTISIPAGTRVHITSKNRKYASDIITVSVTKFDFWLYAPPSHRVYWMFRDEHGRDRQVHSATFGYGESLSSQAYYFGLAYKSIQKLYGAYDGTPNVDFKGWFEGTKTGPYSTTNKFVSKAITSDTWLWAYRNVFKVHFMLNDEHGNVQELHMAELEEGTTLKTSYLCFSTALDAIVKRYDAEVAKHADKWYEGNRYEATDWSKKFESRVVDREIWIWAYIDWYKVKLYVDGREEHDCIFESPRMPLGRKYVIPDSSLNSAKKGSCNLSNAFGTSAGNGFTGWFKDEALSIPADLNIANARPGVLKLYARNRATLRVGYAPGSVLPKPDGDYRIAPRDDAPVYERAMQLPDFSVEPSHRLDNVNLPATGDWGGDHACGYYDEILELPPCRRVYERLGDGRWRTYSTEGWKTPDAIAAASDAPKPKRSVRSFLGFRAAAGPASTRIQMKGDTQRLIKWVEAVVDGVETTS